MTKSTLKTFLLLIFITAILFFMNHLCPAQSGDGPIIHMDQTAHTFPPVFEGEKLSHTFTVFNKGDTNLNIKRITSS